nr:hypothetical protein [Rhodococcus sp. 06-156-3b]
MTGYEDVVRSLGQGASDVVAQLWESVQSGRLSVDEFQTMTAELITVANGKGASVAEASLRAYVEAETGTVDLSTPTVRAAPTERLHRALGTILASDLDTLMQLKRLAFNEPLGAASEAYTDGIKRHKSVKGWRRGVELKPCQLCQWWARDDRVWPSYHPMPRHTGCLCHPIPVISQDIKDLSYAGSASGYDGYRANLDRRARGNNN